MQFDGLTMRACLTDLRSAALGGRVQRISQLSPVALLVDIYAGRTLALVLSAQADAACLFLARDDLRAVLPPTPFCSTLRRQLTGSRLESATQQGWDRCASLVFAGRDELGDPISTTLVLETMGKHSNLICVRDGRILDAAKRIGRSRSRARQILPGLPYAEPPAQDKLSPDTVTAQDLLATVADADPARVAPPQRIAKRLLTQVLGIGPLRAMALATAAMEATNQAMLDDLTPGEPKPGSAAAALAALVRQAAVDAGWPPSPRAGNADPDNRAAPSDLTVAAVEKEFRSFLAGETPTTVGLGTRPAVAVQTRLAMAVAAALERVQRRLSATQDQLDRLAAADEARLQADAIFANLSELRHLLAQGRASGRQELLVDLSTAGWTSTGPNAPMDDGITGEESDASLTLTIDTATDPSVTAQRLYERYAQLKRSRETLESLGRQAALESEHLAALAFHLSGDLTEAELAEVTAEAVAAGIKLDSPSRPRRTTRTQPAPVAASQPRRLTSPGGFEVLVGRNNRQNEALLRVGLPDDVWLHARGVPGAHVLLRQPNAPAAPGGEPPQPDLAFAAALAAYHSQARTAGRVAVDWCRLARVRKQKGAPPGFVTYTGERTLHVQPSVPDQEPR